jgi:hypothetical protein
MRLVKGVNMVKINYNKLNKMEFLGKYATDLLQAIPKSLFQPVPEKYEEELRDLASLNRPPFEGQVQFGILPTFEALKKYRAAILNADMGTGKTQMSFSAAFLYLKHLRKAGKVRNKLLFMTAGSKHLRKMQREAEEILGLQARVFVIGNKYANEKKPRNEVTPEEAVKMKPQEGEILVFLLSKDTGKVGMKEEPYLKWGAKCPSCGERLLTKSGFAKFKKKPSELFSIAKKLRGEPRECVHCQAKLLTLRAQNVNTVTNPVFESKAKPACSKGVRKITVGKRIKRVARASKVFDLLIVDEVHEMQGKDTLQSLLYRDLVSVSVATMIMTGTLANGYPSSVFYILQALMPKYFKENGYTYDDVVKFVEHYGSKKITISVRGGDTKVEELPKISDKIVPLLAPFTSWMTMRELNVEMPSYQEEAIIVSPDDAIKDALSTFKKQSKKVMDDFEALRYVRVLGLKSLYIQNNPFYNKIQFSGKGYIWVSTSEIERRGLDVLSIALKSSMAGGQETCKVETGFFVPYKPLDKEELPLTSKEKALINRLRRDVEAGRGALVYSIYNKAGAVSDRLYEVISREIPQATVKLLPENVASANIEAWIENNPCDILIASPIKLATGLDLVQFPSIHFYESGTNLRVVQQAKKRSYRAVGQDHDVKVFFYAYDGLEAKLLDIMGKKMRAAAVIEGHKVDDTSIASVFDDDSAFTEALNSIADEIKAIAEPDLSYATIEGGKARPTTDFEKAYLAILEEVRSIEADGKEVEVKEEAEVISVESDADTSDADSSVLTVEVESFDKLSAEAEKEDNADELFTIPAEIKIKEIVNPRTQTKQLAFEF